MGAILWDNPGLRWVDDDWVLTFRHNLDYRTLRTFMWELRRQLEREYANVVVYVDGEPAQLEQTARSTRSELGTLTVRSPGVLDFNGAELRRAGTALLAEVEERLAATTAEEGERARALLDGLRRGG